MKKIIAAFDGLRFSESTLNYAIDFGKHYNAHIVGVFLTETTKMSYAVYEAFVEQSLPGKELVNEIGRNDSAEINESVSKFEAICRDSKISYSIHYDKFNPLEELLHESLFADLLIMDPHESFSYFESRMPGGFVKHILQHSKCPIIVVPSVFRQTHELVMLYDGSASSVFAIKMFNYVLPEMNNLDITILNAGDSAVSKHIPDELLMEEWMKNHFPNATFRIVEGGKKALVNELTNESTNKMVIVGAYNRSSLSMRIHKSIADLLLKDIKYPVFIAHA